MPFMADGTPVDVVLNPLGRTFTYECGAGIRNTFRLGCKNLGMNVATPISMVFQKMKQANQKLG